MKQKKEGENKIESTGGYIEVNWRYEKIVRRKPIKKKSQIVQEVKMVPLSY